MIESDLPSDRARARENLSALMDGECDHASVVQACRRWRQDDDLRAQWHTYHLIGDVLRSDDLARSDRRDAAFLQAVRDRLAREPVVLAPLPLAEPAAVASARHAVNGAPSPRRPLLRMRRWVPPVGMAAGVALVAGAVLVTRPDAIGQASLTAAAPAVVERVRTPAAPTEIVPVQVAAPASIGGQVAAAPVVADSEMVRYVNAHQQFPGATALGPAPGFLRSSAAYEAIPSR